MTAIENIIREEQDKENIPENENIINQLRMCNNKCESTKNRVLLNHDGNVIVTVVVEDPLKIKEKASVSAFNVKRPNEIITKEEKCNKENKKINYRRHPEYINYFYDILESDKLINTYGISFFKYNKMLDQDIWDIPENFCERHKNLDIKTRNRMVDWMLEVLNCFEQTIETFFLSVNIMDMYLYKTNEDVNDDDIHLLGICSMFLASKCQEIYPITLDITYKNIGHYIFTPKQIKSYEIKVLSTITPKYLVSTSNYDFTKTFFYDFQFNNKKFFKNEKDFLIFDLIKKVAIYICKMVKLLPSFYSYKNVELSFASIASSVKIVDQALNLDFKNSTKKGYLSWIKLLSNSFQKSPNVDLVNLADRIYFEFFEFQKTSNSYKNLNKYSKLPESIETLFKE